MHTRHYDLHATILLAQSIENGDLDIVKPQICGTYESQVNYSSSKFIQERLAVNPSPESLTAHTDSRIFHLSTADALCGQGYDQYTDALFPAPPCAYSCGTEICKDAICNPLFGSVHNVHIASLLGDCCDSRHIGPGCITNTKIIQPIFPLEIIFFGVSRAPSGSVTPRQNLELQSMIPGTNFLFCSSVPYRMRGGAPIELPHVRAQITPK